MQKYTPDTLPYHLVVPSLPGFTLSGMPLLDHDISQLDVARIMDSLMRQIGFQAYVAQGGDVGSRVARIMAVDHDACKGRSLCVFPSYRLLTRPLAVHRKIVSSGPSGHASFVQREC
jgi:microsomal epoxide hydrolase